MIKIRNFTVVFIFAQFIFLSRCVEISCSTIFNPERDDGILHSVFELRVFLVVHEGHERRYDPRVKCAPSRYTYTARVGVKAI